jgi:hypothetical protein
MRQTDTALPEVSALARPIPNSPPSEVLSGVGGGSGFGRFASTHAREMRDGLEFEQVDHVGLSSGAEAARGAAAAWGELATAIKDGRPTAEHVQSVRDAEARALDNQ